MLAPRQQTHYYAYYHHYYLRGALSGILIAALVACFARHHWRVALLALLALLVFHLHLLCDFVGSHGPAPEDLWPICYFGPFDKDPIWVWKGQLRLDGWFNRYLSAALFVWALWLPVRFGHSVVGVFSRRADQVFVGCCASGTMPGCSEGCTRDRPGDARLPAVYR